VSDKFSSVIADRIIAYLLFRGTEHLHFNPVVLEFCFGFSRRISYCEIFAPIAPQLSDTLHIPCICHSVAGLSAAFPEPVYLLVVKSSAF